MRYVGSNTVATLFALALKECETGLIRLLLPFRPWTVLRDESGHLMTVPSGSRNVASLMESHWPTYAAATHNLPLQYHRRRPLSPFLGYSQGVGNDHLARKPDRMIAGSTLGLLAQKNRHRIGQDSVAVRVRRTRGGSGSR